ncbi:hypothetical protein CEXT_472751 [Caerostris extrusa]|uniref:Uncharacterized protein n=1 Tax=Caerostris extrusa TaxID=172846 RepID=A0AAV4XBI7_CAEEX|nr:hypothetical protein CEXT_472751 [Caerostris extrusa]
MEPSPLLPPPLLPPSRRGRGEKDAPESEMGILEEDEVVGRQVRGSAVAGEWAVLLLARFAPGLLCVCLNADLLCRTNWRLKCRAGFKFQSVEYVL